MMMMIREKLTFSLLHGQYDPTPSIHNTFSQGNKIIHHLEICFGTSNECRGLEYLCYCPKVLLKVAANGLSNVSKALKYGWP